MIMKKKLFFAAVAIVALASCADNEYVGEVSPNLKADGESAIVFNSGANALTRADKEGQDAATALGSNFVVEGIKWNGGSSEQVVVFNNYNVNYSDGSAYSTTSNTAGWEYVSQTPHYHGLNTAPKITAQSIKYWDYAKSQYDFIAYSLGSATAVYKNTDYDVDANVLVSNITPSTMGSSTGGAYTIKGKAENLAKFYIADLKTAYRDAIENVTTEGDYQKTVKFVFRSLSAKVRVALYETIPGYSVQNVVFYTDASTPATDSKAYLYTTGNDVFNEVGTYTVYFPTTGSSNISETDYNKAHLSFTAESSGTETDKNFGSFAYDEDTNPTFANKEVSETAGYSYLGRASNAATYAGVAADNYYTVVIPNETGAVLNLKVNYQLVSTDGSGETIDVTGATAQVPSKFAEWKSGYAYTYIFKISQNSDGKTNPDLDPVGLYPITFDAVVTESEEHIQETITTVADPSITTYSKGKVVTVSNEYKTNSDIYIVVDNGTALSATNAKMYIITLESDADQTINEASVANLLNNVNYANGTWTVTDKDGKTMTASERGLTTGLTSIPAEAAPDGNAITINCAKFTTGVAGTYAFEYTDVNGDKHYKIIKVVN